MFGEKLVEKWCHRSCNLSNLFQPRCHNISKHPPKLNVKIHFRKTHPFSMLSKVIIFHLLSSFHKDLSCVLACILMNIIFFFNAIAREKLWFSLHWSEFTVWTLHVNCKVFDLFNVNTTWQLLSEITSKSFLSLWFVIHFDGKESDINMSMYNVLKCWTFQSQTDTINEIDLGFASKKIVVIYKAFFLLFMRHATT